MRERVGLVGLGLVGKALAHRLIAAGYRVVGFDTAPEACDAAQTMGVEVVGTVQETAQRALRVVLLSLPDSTAVEDVLWGCGKLGEAVSPGVIILDTTTTHPRDTVSHSRRLTAKEVRFVDAPLVGSSQEIAQGKAVALLGDAEAAAQDYAEVVRSFSERIFFMGDRGNGHRAKLVVNLVLGLNRLVLAEGLGLAARTGLDLRLVLDVLKSSAAYSRIMDTKGERMLSGDFQPAARLAQHAKDVGLIRELAQEVGARVPVSDLHARMLADLIASGHGALDNAAVIKAYLDESRP